MTAILPCDPADPRAAAARAAYYSELAARFPAGFDPGPDTPQGLEEMRPPGGIFLLAEEGATLHGCVALRTLAPGVGEIKRLWVSPSARGMGLAGRLMQAVEDSARSFGHRTLRLDTNGTLTEALAFYRRRGWTEIPRYNDNPYAEAWFERAL